MLRVHGSPPMISAAAWLVVPLLSAAPSGCSAKRCSASSVTSPRLATVRRHAIERGAGTRQGRPISSAVLGPSDEMIGQLQRGREVYEAGHDLREQHLSDHRLRRGRLCT